MIQPLLMLGCLGIGICALGCAHALYRLHRICPRDGIQCDRGLLRCYCGGFDLPLRLASALTVLSAALLILSWMLNMPAGLITALLVLLTVSGFEKHFGNTDRRKLEREAYRIGLR
ncbi:MAG: hypothetical protein JWQ90_103 [Hydrocarboniphaga sp.]|uniref:hypothetical protein n=1 Tax=Hydrocarboniphaga sp. TaxID=2033016 RepID=UPI00263592EC|nr:hypothetical protein [Hydrocarboniphaga sp.]MDB5967653.1 hypothetical protein [Hydrocarboniphaga sp.]